jgi:hyperosmotically inducible periplasmic protein
MTSPTCIASLTLAAGLALCSCDARNGNGTTADNTSRNSTDQQAGAKTPIDQAQSGNGIDTTAAIRRAIMQDASMSTNAQNCKIITDTAGTITLRGVVNSQQEKDAVESHARAVARNATIVNQLEVKTT